MPLWAGQHEEEVTLNIFFQEASLNKLKYCWIDYIVGMV